MGTGTYEESIRETYGTTYGVGSGVSTTATTASTMAYAGGNDDIVDMNIRAIYPLAVDVWALQGQLSRLIETLRERKIIPS